MPTGFTIKPRVFKIQTPNGGADILAGETFQVLLLLRDEVKASVIDKMRRGASGAVVSEQASVEAEVAFGDRPSLTVFSNDVRAAVDEGGRAARGIPPFGHYSALAQWAELVFGTRDFHRVRGLALAIAERGQPAPGDRLNRPFGRTQIEYNPIVRRKMAEARARAVERMNKRS